MPTFDLEQIPATTRNVPARKSGMTRAGKAQAGATALSAHELPKESETVIRLSSLRRPLETLAPRTSRTVATVIGVASVAAAVALTTAPAHAAAAPQASASHTVSPAVLVWRYTATFATEDQCEAVGLAEFESGEALDYRCSEVLACPSRWNLFLLLNASAPAAALPARFSAAQPAC